MDGSLVVIGSGPGIGVTTAKKFAAQGFKKIFLLARNEERIQQERNAVLEAGKEVNADIEVNTISVDITDLSKLRSMLQRVQGFGPVECVFFNAAKVAPSKVLETPVEEIEEDFRTTNLALYETAKWAIPLLKQRTETSPSFIVTNSLLYKEPISFVFCLSLVKAAQRSMVLSLHDTFGKEVHIALVSVGGMVSPDNPKMSPDLIGTKIWELYKQPKEEWARDIEILDS